MRFIGLATRGLRRRPLRSLLTAVGVAAAVAAFIVLVGLSRGVERAWAVSLRHRGTHVLAVQKGAVTILTGSLDERLGDRLRKVDGVTDAASELGDLMEAESGRAVLLAGWPRDAFLWDSLRSPQGGAVRPGAEGGVVLGESAAEALHKRAGDRVRIGGREFPVVGVAAHGGALGGGSAIMDLAAMQKITGRAGKVTGFHLRIASPDDAAKRTELLGRLRAAFPELTFFETDRVGEDNGILRLFRAVAWGTSLVAFLIALVVILNTLLVSVLERTREIGVLRAVGWTTRRIVSLIVMEGLMLAAVGAAAGVCLGVTGFLALATRSGLQGFVEPVVDVPLILQSLVGALLLGALGSLYPAHRTARLDPVEALREP